MSNRFFFQIEDTSPDRRLASDWVEDSFAGSHRGYRSDVGSDFIGLGLSARQVAGVFLVLCIGLSVLVGRSFYVQIVQSGYYLSQAEDNRIKIDHLKAPRGIIYDRNGQALVQNVSGFSLLIVPADLPKDEHERQQNIENISKLAGVSIDEIKQAIDTAHSYYFQPILIKTGIDYDEAMKLKIASADLPGMIVGLDSWRRYPLGEDLGHVLGYVGKINADEYEQSRENYLLSDSLGKTGIEKQYEEILRGRHGQKKVEVDSRGRPKKIIAQEDSIAGDNLVLAIDAGLQSKVFAVLRDKLKDEYKAAVIISDPRNGEILALVDYPSYDNNLFIGGISQGAYQSLIEDVRRPLFARSVLGEYPSGSTIKPVVSVAALAEGVVDRQTSFLSVGGINIGQWRFPDWKAGGHGTTNVIKAIAESVNTFFYYVGGGYGGFTGLGIDRLGNYFKIFGLGVTSGIDLPGEATGFIPTPQWKEEAKDEAWYIGDTYHVAIGQGDLTVTPLQVNNFTATIANGGTFYRPRLVTGRINPAGELQSLPISVINQQVVDRQYVDIVREGMRQTVVAGSARSLSIVPVPVAGKTGTAQWNSNEKNHAWFTGFAPYDNPTFAVTVLVEAGGEGSSIAVPIAKELLIYWFSR